MSGSALGAALEIPKSALDKIKEADDKLVKLQQTANGTASSVKTSFATMEGGAKGFIGALDQIINKLNVVNSTANKMPKSLSTTGAIIRAAESIDRLSESTKRGFKELFSQEKMLAAAVSILAEKRAQAEEKVKQAKQATAVEVSKTAIVEEKAAQSDAQAAAQRAKTSQEIAKANKEIYKSQQEVINADKEKIKIQTADANKSAEVARAATAEAKAKGEVAKQKRAETKATTEDVKLKTQEAKLSTEQARLKKAEAQAHLTNAQAIEKESRARELETKAKQRANNSNNKATNYSDFNGIISQYANVSVLGDHKKAVQDLQKARMSLITTDANYKQNLATINEAIKQHSKVLKDAGLNARNLGEQYSYLSGYLSRLAQRTAVVFSMSAAKSFVENVAEVRGQMEMSQRSLESILQNKPKADEIFNKTVELAVKSPFRIKDLVDYTRQLSAYRIESDKLYDTTKRLADVSAGLGVDMGRLILAYGQVKAAAYLRGSEVRQFTEAGINMYGELQQYFKEVKGEAYTTAQIVDMISKRKVTFEDVEAIFQRMTDKGGTFYNMQEIQAETLQGKISNLHDAFDVMLNDIGKDKEGLFKGLITTTTSLLDNWKAIASVVEAIIAMFATVKLQSMFMKSSLGMAFSQASGTNAQKMKALWVNAFGSMEKAAKAFGSVLKTSLVGLVIYGVIETITTVIDKYKRYNELVKEAKEETIKSQGAIGAIAGSYNDLANAADNANKKLSGKDLEKNINDRRTALQKLIDTAAKDGIVFNIKVADIKDEELNAVFEKTKKKYQDFVDDLNVIEERYASDDKWNTWVTDGLDDNADDYKKAVTDLLSQSMQMEQVVSVINANYDKATASTKKYFDEIRAGQHDGESNLDYWMRMNTAAQNIAKGLTGLEGYLPEWMNDVSKMFSDMGAGIDEINSKGQDLSKDFDTIFGDLRKRYNNDPVIIKAVIDRVAAKHDWNQYERDLAYKKFGIYVYINKQNIENEVSWVDDYLANFFANKKYGIKLSVEQIDDTSAIDDYLSQGDKAAGTARKWKDAIDRLKKSYGDVITIDSSIKKILAETPYENMKTIKKSVLLSYFQERLQGATSKSKNVYGIDPFEKNKTKTTKTDKQQRDILQERINLLKDMNSKYDELIKTESKEQALSDTRKYFKEAAQNVMWNANDILPDDSSVAKRIRELGATAKDIAKRGGYFRIAGDIEFKIKKEKFEELKDDISKNIDEAFSQLDLYKKLKEQGLTDDAIKTMFGDMVSSFKEVGETIDNEFNRYTFEAYAEKYGQDFNKWGDKVIAQYNADLEKTAEIMAKSGSDTNTQYLEKRQKLDEKVAQDQVAQAQELIKAYKTQLTEQLQLDKWYYGERMKIRENENIKKGPELQKQLEENLTSQFKKKQADIDWKNFQNSDTYIAIFENLEHTSTKALDYMIEKLRGVREQLKGLDPTQVKTITEQIEKLEQTKNAKNPFKAFTSGYKEMIKANKEFKKLGGIDAWVSKNKLNDAEKADIQDQEALVASLEAEYNQLSENKELESDKAKQLKVSLDVQKAILNQKKADNKTTQEGVDKLNNAKGASEKAKNKFSTSVTDITSMVSAMGQAFGSLGQNLGIADDYFTNSVNLIDHAGQAIGSFYSKNWAGVVSNAVGAVGDIINLFSSESKIDKEIERQERAVTRLQNAYSDLKQSMDDAFDIERLQEYHNKSVETLEDEKKAYEAMIKAEQGRKNPDDGKIEQWQQEIQNLDKTIKELGESLTESLGGFGSEANYKSAAQAFADAWVDAFNEGSDALDALNDKFDDYFNDMLKKQLMQRASKKFIEPILKAFDDAVAKGSEGGNNGYELTKDEIAHIKELKESNLKAFDDYARNLMDVLGVTPSGSSNLSNLQQGIQAVTETTAQALESILNSMRYYVSQEQSDVAAIRMILEQRLGAVAAQAVEGGASNQMITLMEQQAGYLKQICDNWSSVLKSGHKQGGKGLKVFMN